MEECIPTTCPLKINVEFSNALPEGVLAVVQTKSAEGMLGGYGEHTFDKIYAKRYEQIHNESGFSDKEEGLKFYRNSEDATITFSSKAKFNYISWQRSLRQLSISNIGQSLSICFTANR